MSNLLMRSLEISMRRMTLVQQFSLLLLGTLFLMGLFLGKIVSSALREDMANRSNEITAGFIKAEIDHHIRVEAFSPKSDVDYEGLSRQVALLNLGPGIQKIKIWNRERIVVWASESQEVGRQNRAHHELENVFSGKTISEISSKERLREKYAYEIDHDVMELYIPVRSGDSGEVVLVFEIYKNIDELMASIRHQTKIVWASTFCGAFVLYFILLGLVWRASRRLAWQNRQIGFSEERYRSLIHSAQDGIVSCDRQGRIILLNQAAEQIFGYTFAEAETFTFASLLGAGAGEEILSQLTACATTGNCTVLNKSFEAVGIRKNGATFPVEVSLSVSGESENLMLTGLFRDTSKRQQLMEQLAAAKNEWEETFDTINEAITIQDIDFNIIRANRAAVEMLALPQRAILDQKCFQSYHGTEAPPARCPSCMAARSGSASVSEMYEPHLDKYIEVKSLPRFNKQQELIGIVHVVRDITEQKKAEEKHLRLQDQLNQVQKMETVGKLAGGIAHDFNNMLSAIIGYSEIVLMSLPQDSYLRDDVKTIKEAGEKAAVLTRQLLAFSRKQVLEVKAVDLNSIVEGMVKMLARVIGENIQLDLRLKPKLGRIIADRGQIEQVLLNLAVNARDAMPSGGRLTLETGEVDVDEEFIEHHADAKAGPHILLTVTDTGTGMAEEVRQRIFEPFFTTKEVGRGTGLGLATVYGIVKQHGGLIFVQSEPGKGTTFTIYMPRTKDDADEDATQSPQSIPAGKETVLLVEDDATIRRMIKNILESEGYKLIVAADGLEAMEAAQSYAGEIHLLLTDVIMPNLNGKELADSLKKIRPAMEVIFMSGYTDDFIAHHGVLEPDVHFLQKPVTPSNLAQKIRQVLKKQ